MQDCSDTKKKLYELIEKKSDKKKCLTIADIDSEYRASKRVAANTICINNGIDVDELDGLIDEIKTNGTEKLNNTSKRSCMLGKAVPQKNPKLFNEIALRLPEYEFLWIGAGPLENELSSSNITVTGWLSRKEALEKVYNSDLFLFTSAWESLSIALLEVMYIGVPCVVSNIPENTDVIHDGINGVSCESVDEYVNAIKVLMNNKEQRENYAAKAKNDILQKYNTGKIEMEYKQLFEKMGI